MANIVLDYARKDLGDVLTQLYQQIGTFTNGNWTDFLATDIGTAFTQIMAQLNDFNLFFTDASVAECYLSTCQLRESAVRLAKMLNYSPAQAVPATVEVLLTFPAFNTQVNIAANSQWTINNIAFTCQDAITIPQGQTQLNISLVQGQPYTNTITAPGTPWFTVVIPDNAAKIVVSVNSVTWQAIDTWLVIPQPNVYKVYEDQGGQTIIFGAGQNTTMPASGATIAISAILTDGAAGNIPVSGQNVIAVTAIRDGNGNLLNNTITATTTGAALGGLDVESTQSIAINAPAFYGTQGRAVTASDYEALVANYPGVSDVLAIGGENLNNLRTVAIIVYGDSPYSVSPTLLTNISNYLTNLNVGPIIPIVQAPNVINMNLTVNAGISSLSFNDASQAVTAITNLANLYFAPNTPNNLQGEQGIGDSFYNSVFSAAVQNLGGINYLDLTISLTSSGTSAAGVVSIPVPTNADVTHCTLVNASQEVLFSGDGSDMVAANVFTFSQQGLSDQVCTLTYTVSPLDGSQTYDVLCIYNQIIVLNSLQVNTEFA